LPRIWLKCSITKSTILEMPTKRRSSKFKIKFHAQIIISCLYHLLYPVLVYLLKQSKTQTFSKIHK
jgi:hypothetical protein